MMQVLLTVIKAIEMSADANNVDYESVSDGSVSLIV